MPKKKTTKKQATWFVKVRGSYLPNNRQGWLTYIPFVTFLLGSLFLTVTYVSPLALAILLVFPQWVAAVSVMTWVAAHSS